MNALWTSALRSGRKRKVIIWGSFQNGSHGLEAPSRTSNDYNHGVSWVSDRMDSVTSDRFPINRCLPAWQENNMALTLSVSFPIMSWIRSSSTSDIGSIDLKTFIFLRLYKIYSRIPSIVLGFQFHAVFNLMVEVESDWVNNCEELFYFDFRPLLSTRNPITTI